MGSMDDDDFIIGDTVWVNGAHRGKIAFLGETSFGKGEYAGIVLDEGNGKSDGTVSGVMYFQCAANHGIFTRLNRLTRQPLLPMEREIRAQTPPRCLAERQQRSPSPFTFTSSAPAPLYASTPSPKSPGPKTPTRLGSTSPTPPARIGERVIIQSSTSQTRRGILRFLGNTEFANGEWAGVELDQPIGKNNGSVAGIRYFDCREDFGIFVPSHKITASPINQQIKNNMYTTRSGREGSYESEYY